MSEPQPEPTPEPDAPAAQGKPKLEDLLADLGDDARKAVLGEVAKARTEAKGLRDRLKAAEPSLAELDRLKAASKSYEEQQADLLAAATKRAEQAERDALRARVAISKGLDEFETARLIGDDESALEADADQWLARRPSTNPRAPRVDMSQGSSAAGAASSDPGQQFAAIMQQRLGR